MVSLTIRQSRPRLRNGALELVFLLTTLAAALFFCRLRFLLSDSFLGADLFAEVAHHSGPKPWQYRILVPYVADILSQLKLPLLHSLERWSEIAEVSAVFFLVVSFRRYVSLFIPDKVVSSLLSFLVLLILPFNFFFPRPYHPNYWYDMPSILFFTLGLIFLVEKNWLLYYPLFAIATFNRETTCFLTIIYVVSSLGREGRKSVIVHGMSQFAIWMAIKGILANWYASNPGPTFEWYAQPGITHLSDNIAFFTNPVNYPMFLSNMGFIWIPILFYYRRINVEFVKRSLLVVFPWFTGMMFVANIYELRIFGELIPVFLLAFILIVCELLRTAQPGSMRGLAS
jgi:hypothetical protein